MRNRIERALVKVRPTLQAAGGNLELVSFRNGVARLRLTGSLNGNPMSPLPLEYGIKWAIQQEVPEIEGVELVRSHRETNACK